MYIEKGYASCIGDSLYTFWMITHNKTLIQLKAPKQIQIRVERSLQEFVLFWSALVDFPISLADLYIAKPKFILARHNTSTGTSHYNFIQFKDYCNVDGDIYTNQFVFSDYAIDKATVKHYISLIENACKNIDKVGTDMGIFSDCTSLAIGRCTLNFAYDVPMSTITDIYYNEPYTTVKWSDGTVTTVACKDGEDFDKETGLAMCIAKRYFKVINPEHPRAAFKNYISDAIDQTEKTAKRRLYKLAKKANRTVDISDKDDNNGSNSNS